MSQLSGLGWGEKPVAWSTKPDPTITPIFTESKVRLLKTEQISQFFSVESQTVLFHDNRWGAMVRFMALYELGQTDGIKLWQFFRSVGEIKRDGLAGIGDIADTLMELHEALHGRNQLAVSRLLEKGLDEVVLQDPDVLVLAPVRLTHPFDKQREQIARGWMIAVIASLASGASSEAILS